MSNSDHHFKLHSLILYHFGKTSFSLINKLSVKENLISLCSCLLGCCTGGGATSWQVHSDGHERQGKEIAFFIRSKGKGIFIKGVF